jgi:hypothetical protein
VVLSWERPDDPRVTGYKIFYGPAETDFKTSPKATIHSAAQTSLDILNLQSGWTYAFAAKSIDGRGNESVFSEVLYYDVPPAQDGEGAPEDDPQNEDTNGADPAPPDEPENLDPDDKENQDSPEERASSGGGGGGCLIKAASFPLPAAPKPAAND